MSDQQKPEELTEPDIALDANPVRPGTKNDFLISMYSEASNAYFKGVETGLSYIRLYFFINAVLIAGFFSVWKIYLDNKGADYLPIFMLILCFSGIIFSGLLFSLLPGYAKQLRNCLASAIYVEDKFLEKPEDIGLFSQIKLTTKRKFHSIIGLCILFAAILLYWSISIIFVYRMM